MALLELRNIEFNYSDKELYHGVNMKINNGEHCALVGINGAGKTTILSFITGDNKPDRGEVIWEHGITFAYLDQNLKAEKGIKAKQYLEGVFAPLFEKEKRMEELYERSATDLDNFETLLSKAQRIQDELNDTGFYALDEKIHRLTDGLGIPSSILEQDLSTLSSGQREKIFLAKMLLEEKDFLIMDEPTNFLDQIQVEWLKGYLKSYPKAFLLVSHDEGFLKDVANVVFSLEGGYIRRYKGDYAHYLEQHQIDQEQYEKDYLAQQRYIKKEETFIAKHIVRATSSRAAKSHRARLSHLKRLDAPITINENLSFPFPFSYHVGQKPLIVSDLSIGYDEVLVDKISFILHKGEKIAILGQNGVGKTTFVKTILSYLPQLSGEYEWLPGTKIGYFSQDEAIDMETTPFKMVREIRPDLTNTEIRNILSRFGLRNELSMKKLSNLSGGEVAKARLALLSLEPHNFLIFDEPTNHLDKAAKDSLYQAIDKFEGGVILVSHEKDFYDGLVDFELFF